MGKKKFKKKYKRDIIVVGGSMRFEKEIQLVAAYLMNKGEAVYSAIDLENNVLGKCYKDLLPSVINNIMDFYCRDFSDVFIRKYAKAYYAVAINGYVGDGVRHEIDVAKKNGIKVKMIYTKDIDKIEAEICRCVLYSRVAPTIKNSLNIPISIINPQIAYIAFASAEVVLHLITKDAELNPSIFISNNYQYLNQAIDRIQKALLPDDNSYKFKLRAISISKYDHDLRCIDILENYYKLAGNCEFRTYKSEYIIHVIVKDRRFYISRYYKSQILDLGVQHREAICALLIAFNKTHEITNPFIDLLSDVNSHGVIVEESTFVTNMENYFRGVNLVKETIKSEDADNK